MYNYLLFESYFQLGVGALIISPTRELAKQISSVLNPLAEAFGFSCALVIGGNKVKYTCIEKGTVIIECHIRSLFLLLATYRKIS